MESKSIPEDCEGLLRAEVRLTKPKAIRGYTNKSAISKQIANLYDNRQQIFLDTFIRVVPFGTFTRRARLRILFAAKCRI
jgi:hypothetical protein